MRDLFQVVFALKKKEIELAKQHLDKNRFGTTSLFADTNTSSSKVATWIICMFLANFVF